MNTVTPVAGKANVQFVRFTINSNFGDINNFADVSEIAVHGVRPGAATAILGGPAVIELGATATYTSAGSKGVGGSPIAAQTWTSPGTATGHAATYPVKGAHVGSVRITLAVSDFGGRTGSVSKTVVVRDTVPPTVTLKTKGNRVRKTVTISGTVADLSGVAARATIKFGDGKSASVPVRSGKFSVKHKYRSRKTFTITITAKDATGLTTRVTRKLKIKK
jgi:hypothetical protein